MQCLPLWGREKTDMTPTATRRERQLYIIASFIPERQGVRVEQRSRAGAASVADGPAAAGALAVGFVNICAIGSVVSNSGPCC